MTLEELVGRGFAKVAQWQRNDAGVTTCAGEVPSEPGIYLFVVQQRILYVGSALGSLRDRMGSYQRKQRSRTLSRPVHAGLVQALDRGESVAIYVRPIAQGERGAWNGLPVDVVLGIEAALIADLGPLWNRRGRALVLDHDAIGSGADDAA